MQSSEKNMIYIQSEKNSLDTSMSQVHCTGAPDGREVQLFVQGYYFFVAALHVHLLAGVIHKIF